MRLLLDTHVFLWLITADPRMPRGWPSILTDPANTVYLSAASVWEAVVKYRLGKLPLPEAASTYLPRQRLQHNIASLSLDEEDAVRLGSLPDLHNDPFDRMLISQALRHNLLLVTVDRAVSQYSVSILPQS